MLRTEMRVCFALGRLGPSGGVRSVLAHARHLAAEHDMDVAIAVTEGPAGDSSAPGLKILTAEDARAQSFDVGVATWWRTVYSLFRIPARRRAYFIQNFEERLYRPGDVERLGAALTRDLPLAFVSEARWIVEELAQLRPDAPSFHVPNGIDKTLFAAPRDPPGRGDGALRVLVEGSPRLWFKGVPAAIEALGAMRAPHHATLVTPEAAPPEIRAAFDEVLGPLPHDRMPAVYAQADVLLKLSRVEGVFTPPLEAFHCGATCVVWPVTGHDEYVEHGVNGIVAGWDDIQGTAHWLDLLATDAELLARLRRGALQTASRWPSWKEAARGMASALREIAVAPEPEGGAGVTQLLGDAHAGLEELRVDQLRLRRELERHAAELSAERTGRVAAEEHAARLEQALASTLRARARRLLASRRR
jgi:O-antigen biosynthesis protein